MRISKSAKTGVKASKSTRPFEVKDLNTGKWVNVDADSYRGAVKQLCDCELEVASNSKDADYLVQYAGSQGDRYKAFTGSYGQTKYFKKVDSIGACGDIEGSTSTDKALQHIKAAIDILGTSGKKDVVTKDSIANLATVMFDIKASKDSSCSDGICVDRVRDNWEEGTVKLPDSDAKVEFWAKVYDEPSDYGINKGRVSKLSIRIDGKMVCNYDRGWDQKPATSEAKTAYKMLLKKYA